MQTENSKVVLEKENLSLLQSQLLSQINLKVKIIVYYF